MKKIFSFLFCVLVCLGINLPLAKADSVVSDWYIKDFQSQIVLNNDSTATITENITADCGNAIGKHGIFRVISLQSQKTKKEVIKTPIQLISITDFNNIPYKYTESLNQAEHTITWKIGDPNKTVQGVNYYRIKYLAKNVIRFDSQNFDEFYWNLNGNFWDLQTDRYSANIVFPGGIDNTKTEVNIYSGLFGEKDAGLADYSWDGSALTVNSKKTLAAKEGITLSVTVPKNIFIPYKLTSEDEKLYQSSSQFFSNLTPLLKNLLTVLGYFWAMLVLVVCYLLWRKYGKDPKINRAVAPEFEIPENLSPIEMGMVNTNGGLDNNFISATIVNLAVKNYLAIEIIGKTGLLSKEDYKLKKLKDGTGLNDGEAKVLGYLFEEGDEILISKLMNKFYIHLSSIAYAVTNILKNQDLLKTTGSTVMIILLIVGSFSIFGSVYSFRISNYLGYAMLASTAILFFFAIIMPLRPMKGAELEMRIKGFKMYLETAEKYRQQFNEKENIFEKFLPYAMIFGLTKKWITAMKEIYGEEYFRSYQPAWLYGGTFLGGDFSIDQFADHLNSMTSNMAQTIASSPSSSGSGGGGFSGGGGGGGGGGGW